MATAGSFGKATRSPDGRSQAIRPETQRQRDLGSFAGSFGITAPDTRSHLHRLLRREDNPLPDHALAVKRLARIAYGDLPETQRQQYTLEDFTQSVNHPGLNHQLQARGVTSLEAPSEKEKHTFGHKGSTRTPKRRTACQAEYR